MSRTSLRILLVALGALAVVATRPLSAEENNTALTLQLGTIQETEAKAKLPEPNFGYVGQLGSFYASRDNHPMALFVVHNFPDTENNALGRTPLTYEGARRLGNVDGWVFKTEWDGKAYPSKIFVSSEKVYFGGGVSAYIAADYREKTGWVWKLHPLRRMELAKKA